MYGTEGVKLQNTADASRRYLSGTDSNVSPIRQSTHRVIPGHRDWTSDALRVQDGARDVVSLSNCRGAASHGCYSHSTERNCKKKFREQISDGT